MEGDGVRLAVIMVFLLLSALCLSPDTTTTTTPTTSTTPTMNLTEVREVPQETVEETGPEIVFYVYVTPDCCKCRKLLEHLEANNATVVVYTVNGSMGELFEALEEYPSMRAFPLTGVFYNGTLVAVISGYTEPYDVESVISRALRYNVLVLVGYDGSVRYVGSAEKRARFEELFLPGKV